MKTDKHGSMRFMRWSTAILLLLFLCWSPSLLAENCSSSSPTINLPDFTVKTTDPVGTLLGSAQSVSVTFSCTGLPVSGNSQYAYTATIQAGNLAPADPLDNPTGNAGIVFATNVPGIGVKLTATPVQASDNACIRCGPNSSRGFEPGAVTVPSSTNLGTGSGTVSERFTAQFIKTGTVTPGIAVTSLQLMQFAWYIYGIGATQPYFASLSIGNANVTTIGCSVSIASQNLNVNLPTVALKLFTGVGSKAGATPFSIDLSCQPGTKATVTMSATNANTTTTGVINNATTITGKTPATGIGVQLTNTSGTGVNVRGTAQTAVTATGQALSLPYVAQYYQTAATTKAGAVQAVITFTMSYQ